MVAIFTTERWVKAIMYRAYGTHHRPRNIGGIEYQLTHHPSE